MEDDPSGDADALIHYLRERDATCPSCKYNLRGSTSTRCPECGQELRLTVSLVEPKMMAWVATFAAVLLPAGIGVLAFFMLAREAFLIGKGTFANVSGLPAATIYLYLHAFTCLPISVAVVALRRRFLRIPRGVQWAWAAVGWAATLASSLILISDY